MAKSLEVGAKGACCICTLDVDDPAVFGEKYRWKDYICHYFCLLLSDGVAQTGEDNDGIWGFVEADLKAARERAPKMCHLCRRPGGSVKCSKRKCSRRFHLSCGAESGTISFFCNSYKSFCNRHARKYFNHDCTATQMCMICLDSLAEVPKHAIIWADCCKISSFMHKACAQMMALNAGAYYLKCPLCHNVDIFGKCLQRSGIFVPERDASWEMEPGAFRDIHERDFSCSLGQSCKSPFGPNHDTRHWNLVPCKFCGLNAVHQRCLTDDVRPRAWRRGWRWTCEVCRSVVSKKDSDPPQSSLANLSTCSMPSSPDRETPASEVSTRPDSRLETEPDDAPLTNPLDEVIVVGSSPSEDSMSPDFTLRFDPMEFEDSENIDSNNVIDVGRAGGVNSYPNTRRGISNYFTSYVFEPGKPSPSPRPRRAKKRSKSDQKVGRSKKTKKDVADFESASPTHHQQLVSVEIHGQASSSKTKEAVGVSSIGIASRQNFDDANPEAVSVSSIGIASRQNSDDANQDAFASNPADLVSSPDIRLLTDFDLDDIHLSLDSKTSVDVDLNGTKTSPGSKTSYDVFDRDDIKTSPASKTSIDDDLDDIKTSPGSKTSYDVFDRGDIKTSPASKTSIDVDLDDIKASPGSKASYDVFDQDDIKTSPSSKTSFDVDLDDIKTSPGSKTSYDVFGRGNINTSPGSKTSIDVDLDDIKASPGSKASYDVSDQDDIKTSPSSKTSFDVDLDDIKTSSGSKTSYDVVDLVHIKSSPEDDIYTVSDSSMSDDFRLVLSDSDECQKGSEIVAKEGSEEAEAQCSSPPQTCSGLPSPLRRYFESLKAKKANKMKMPRTRTRTRNVQESDSSSLSEKE